MVYDKMEGFSPSDSLPPKGSKEVTEDEGELLTIYDAPPTKYSTKFIENWNNIGVYDLSGQLANKNFEINYPIDSVKFEVKKDSKSRFNG